MVEKEKLIETTDPSQLTTQVIWREVNSLKELFETRLEAIETSIRVAHDDMVRVPTEVQKQVSAVREVFDQKIKVVETRLDCMDKEVQHTQSAVSGFPVRIDEKLRTLHELLDEKFGSVQHQLIERELRREQAARDSKMAVDAALQAQEKAVAKSETATLKQIDQQGALIQQTTKTFDDKISDVKDRLTRIEGAGEGTTVARTDQRQSNSFVVGLVFGVGGILVGIAGLIARFAGR